jgi:formate hydrogenlyase transcriptional activator
LEALPFFPLAEALQGQHRRLQCPVGHGNIMKFDDDSRANRSPTTLTADFGQIIDATPGFVWSASADGSIEFLNQRGLAYTGFSLEQIRGWNWKDTNILHPDDMQGLFDTWSAIVESGQEGEVQARVRRFDGEYKWFLFRVAPLRDPSGRVVGLLGIDFEIDERKRAEEELRRSEFYLGEGQRLAHMGSWAFDPCGFFDHWSRELFHIYGLEPEKGAPTLEEYLGLIHPQDREFMARTIEGMLAESLGCDLKKRIVRPDGDIRYIRCVGVPVVEDGTLKRIVGTAIDVTEQEHLTQERQRREANLAEAQRLSHTGSFGWSVSTGELVWSEETFRILGCDPGTEPSLELLFKRIHPEDFAFVQETIDRAANEGSDLDFDHRLLMPDGSIKHVHVVTHGVRDESGELELVGAVSDITATKIAEERIGRNERELRQIVDAIPQLVTVLAPDGETLYVNKRVLEFTGLSLGDIHGGALRERVIHPEDRGRFREEIQRDLSRGIPFESEHRVLGKDGQFRWFLNRFNPLLDEVGHVIRWYVTGIDIDDRKQAEERVQRENLALREEIDRSSMFEEIVGSSEELRKVLSQVAKVAPADSTVLILGETGTGKELIARAIHKRSRRSTRAFIRVNCAAIPPSLIASELFGHEKGAFTGALQRRLGRFESANGGTIFLDEIGDLPVEAQVALLRVLQDREFERVGSNHSVPVDVRVLAATNRDLKASVAQGTFRQDLFYRLNVFPIQIPPLRARADDIPLLVGYLIDRYGDKAGKKIRNISKKTLELFQAYDWPGNIRELQNVIERAVILCEGETFAIDETWLKRESPQHSGPTVPFVSTLVGHQKEMIEAALAQCHGRIAGPIGAAAKLGIPRQTLESKIAKLGINRHQFKTA